MCSPSDGNEPLGKSSPGGFRRQANNYQGRSNVHVMGSRTKQWRWCRLSMLAVNPLLYSGDSLTYEGSIPYASGTIPGRSMIISKYHACGGRGFPGQGAFGGGGGWRPHGVGSDNQHPDSPRPHPLQGLLPVEICSHRREAR